MHYIHFILYEYYPDTIPFFSLIKKKSFKLQIFCQKKKKRTISNLSRKTRD